MISAPRSSAETATPANIKAQRLDTNQQTVPLGYWSGRKWWPLTWCVSKVYNPKVTEKSSGGGKGGKGGGGKTTTYSGDLGGLVALGPADWFEAVRINGQIVWAAGIERDGSNPDHCEISIPDFVDTLRMHWGNRTQAGDWIVLNTGGETHPNYKDQIIVELKGLQFGASNTPPNVEVLLERAPFVDGLDNNRTREGANPVTAMAEVFGNDFYGLNLPDVVDITTGATLCDALAAREKTVSIPGDPAHVAKMSYLSTYLTERQTVRTFLGAVMENFDGWARRKADKIEFGYFPHDGTIPGDLVELTLHDLAEDPDFGNPGFDDASIITDTIVTGPDRDLDMEDSWQPGTNQAARNRLNQSILKTFPRPFVHTSYQQREQAHELANYYSKPEDAVEEAFRREKAKTLFPGDRFILNYGPSSSRQVFRVARRRDPARGGILYLSIVTERTISPLPLIPDADPVPDLPEPPAPTTVAHATIFQFPAPGEFDLVPTVVPLVERPDAHVLGFAVALSTDDATYDEIGRSTHWALRATLHTTITSGTATITIDASGLDLESILVSQSDAQRDNDTLTLFIGGEIMSVGAVTALGGGQYSLAVLRARLSTAAAAHTAADVCYLIPRENLLTLQHEAIPLAGGTRYFKLPTFTDSAEQDLSAALKLTVSIAAIAVPAPTSIGLTSGDSTVLRFLDGTAIPRVLASWTAPASSLVQSEGNIRIEFKKSADTIWNDGGFVRGDQVSALVVGFIEGDSALVRVRSEYRDSVSSWLTSGAHTVLGDQTAPGVPTSLAVSAYAGFNHAKWVKPAGEPPSKYNVYRGTSSTFGASTKIGETDALQFDDSGSVGGLTAGTTYYYFVTAEDGSHNEGTPTSGVSVVTASPPASDVTPSNPTAPTFSSSSIEFGGDGTAYAALVFNISAMPANAIRQELCVQIGGTGAYTPRKQLTNTGSTTARIDELPTSTSISVILRAWSASKASADISATGAYSPTPNASTPNAPTSIVCSTTTGDLTGAPPRFGPAGSKFGCFKVSWTASTSPDVAYYEIHTDCLIGTPGTGDDQDVRTKGTETFAFLYWDSVSNSSYVPQVRAVSRSEKRSSYTTYGSIVGAGSFSYGTKTLAEQNATSASISGSSTVNGSTMQRSGVNLVDTNRTINGLDLSANRTLTASDVSAVPTTRTINGYDLSANRSLVASDVGAVPNTRTVNGHALSANVTVTAGDLGLGSSDSPTFASPTVTNLNVGTKVLLTGNPGNTSYLGEDWGLKLNGDATHPVAVRACSLVLDGATGGGTNYGTGKIYFNDSVYLHLSSGALWLNDSNGDRALT